MKNKPKETQHTDFLSDCCNEAYYSRCADEGTCHAVCVQCEKPCNLTKSGAFNKPNKVEEMLKTFLEKLNRLVFVKSTNSVTGDVEELEPVIEDQEAIIKICGEWDREDLKSALTSSYEQGRQDERERIEKEKNLYNFGDVFTNGINYWMVVSSEGELRPVVLTKDKKRVSHFVGYYNGSVSSIKPHAHFLGNFNGLQIPQKQLKTNNKVI